MTDGVLAAACPTRIVLDHVTSKWGVLLLVALSERTMRWGELRRIVEGISEKMLAQTLRTLEADGIVHREVTADRPAARRLLADAARAPTWSRRLLPLMEWIVDNADEIVAPA